MITTEEMIVQLFPNKDYNNKLKEQFNYYDMLRLSVNIHIESLKK